MLLPDPLDGTEDSQSQRKGKMDCSEDRGSVSSLPSTLAAYIREEHQQTGSGRFDRCLTSDGDAVADRQS